MSLDTAGEARFEVVVAQAILNEVKYGLETNQLAEVSLLAAFKNRVVGDKLVEALQLLIPGLKYLSIGAILKDGVIVKTSNLAVQGPVVLKPQTLRGSAARVAARKLTAFHTKRRPDEKKLKYYELQDAWDSVQASSVLTVPIPALRRYESASITEDSAAPKSEGDTSCHVLHSLSGAVGIVNFGLNTEDIKLEGRHGAVFQGLAQSLSPFLAYYAESSLQELQGQIQAVASANAAIAAKSKAAAEDDNPQHPTFQWGPRQLTIPANLSPFSAAPFPVGSPRSRCGADLPQSLASSSQAIPARQTSSDQVSAQQLQQQQPSQSPSALGGAVGTADSAEGSDATSSAHQPTKLPEALPQPISPFAAAAQMSKRLFSSKPSSSRLSSASASKQHSQNPSEPDAMANSGDWEPRGSESSTEDAPPPAAIAPEMQYSVIELDAAFIFKRKPVSSVQDRRLSTTTFHQGVLHTPSHHFAHIKPMSTLANLQEEPTTQPSRLSTSQQEEVVVDDHTYSSQLSRRALSTPDYQLNPDGSPPTLEQQMRTRSTCADAVLQSSPQDMRSSIDMWIAQTPSDPTHLQQSDCRQPTQGVVYGRCMYGQLESQPGHEAADVPATQAAAPHSAHRPEWQQAHATTASSAAASQQTAGPPPSAAAFKSQHARRASDIELEEPAQPAAAEAKGSSHGTPGQQHPFWLTFADPLVEAKYALWFGHRVGKVDTVFLCFVLVYITQLLLFTWTLEDQLSLRWPLFGYVVVPLLVLQHGDPSWHLANRPAIISGLRLALHAFLAYFVCHQPMESFKVLDAGGLGPLCIIPLGLMVQYKLHAILHTISCALVLAVGLGACPDEGFHSRLACFTRTFPGVALASILPSMILYFVEVWSRKRFLYSTKAM